MRNSTLRMTERWAKWSAAIDGDLGRDTIRQVVRLDFRPQLQFGHTPRQADETDTLHHIGGLISPLGNDRQHLLDPCRENFPGIPLNTTSASSRP